MRLARDTDREIVTTKRGKRIATSIDGTLTGLMTPNPTSAIGRVCR
jgi:hypothetical protein